MPTLIIEGVGSFDVEKGTRLLNALVEHGGNPRYSCDGKAKCRDCRVEFINGELKKMTKAERARLKDKDVLGKYRLSCQCLVKKRYARQGIGFCCQKEERSIRLTQ